jgi:hypothetical protein
MVHCDSVQWKRCLLYVACQGGKSYSQPLRGYNLPLSVFKLADMNIRCDLAGPGNGVYVRIMFFSPVASLRFLWKLPHLPFFASYIAHIFRCSAISKSEMVWRAVTHYHPHPAGIMDRLSLSHFPAAPYILPAIRLKRDEDFHRASLFRLIWLLQ